MKENKEKETERIILPRRQFLFKTGLGLGALAALNPLQNILASDKENFLTTAFNKDVFRFAVIADTHIIDDFYKGPEGNPLDTETIFLTTKRLQKARETINNIHPAVEQAFIVGDFFHDYPSVDYDFYFKNKTRIDNAKGLIDEFKMPVHVGFGNHDYSVPNVSREMSHELFKEKLGVKPYYSIMHRNYKFIHLNNFIGDTWNNKSDKFNKGTGSMGEEQLNWFEAELKQQKPTFVFVHYPLFSLLQAEIKDYGMLSILKKYKDTIQFVVSGHWHRWFDFARTFGPQHYVMGSTRYDEDAYMIVEVNTKKATHKILNLDLVNWATHYSEPWTEKIKS